MTDQLTVPGMMVPRFEPDVTVVEATYGDRLHASREAEERRLVAAIGETIAAGGKVLVPAFALGRAMEFAATCTPASRIWRLFHRRRGAVGRSVVTWPP